MIPLGAHLTLHRLLPLKWVCPCLCSFLYYSLRELLCSQCHFLPTLIRREIKKQIHSDQLNCTKMENKSVLYSWSLSTLGWKQSHLGFVNPISQTIVFLIFQIPVPVLLLICLWFPVSVTYTVQIPFSQWKFAQIPVPILSLQATHNWTLVSL